MDLTWTELAKETLHCLGTLLLYLTPLRRGEECDIYC